MPEWFVRFAVCTPTFSSSSTWICEIRRYEMNWKTHKSENSQSEIFHRSLAVSRKNEFLSYGACTESCFLKSLSALSHFKIGPASNWATGTSCCRTTKTGCCGSIWKILIFFHYSRFHEFLHFGEFSKNLKFKIWKMKKNQKFSNGATATSFCRMNLLLCSLFLELAIINPLRNFKHKKNTKTSSGKTGKTFSDFKSFKNLNFKKNSCEKKKVREQAIVRREQFQ